MVIWIVLYNELNRNINLIFHFSSQSNPSPTNHESGHHAGHESAGRRVRSKAGGRRLREQSEEREEERQRRPGRAAGRQDLPAVPVLLLSARGPVHRQHVQSVSGRSGRWSSHLADRWDLVRVAAGADDLATRWHSFRAVLQRRQSAAELWAELHVYAQSRYSAECDRGSGAGRWGWAQIIRSCCVHSIITKLLLPFNTRSSTDEPEPSVPHARHRIPCDRYGPVAGHEREKDQFETRPGPGSARSAASTVRSATAQGYDCRTEQRIRGVTIPGRQSRSVPRHQFCVHDLYTNHLCHHLGSQVSGYSTVTSSSTSWSAWTWCST